ncbi:MAG: hypothetical protein HQL41_04960 [Alphaproteobacteria bacterium]|nr:hypothetical protein [Alphaproteobacteria bacterium]
MRREPYSIWMGPQWPGWCEKASAGRLLSLAKLVSCARRIVQHLIRTVEMNDKDLDVRVLGSGDASSRGRKPWRAPRLNIAFARQSTLNNNTPQDDTGGGFGSGNNLPS